ncbi:MAG: septum formation initiator family protein [Coxiellaceae bacterium]|jgi:cell division protein FtsB|nr:septum formation initiator family protein [Coxiellaceae bacterium]
MKVLLGILIVVVIALQYRLWFADDGIIHAWRLNKAIYAQQAKNEDIVKRNTVLIEEIKSLKEGGDAIENCARNDLGMVKKGEIFYQVVK